jgi:hypothetical protein
MVVGREKVSNCRWPKVKNMGLVRHLRSGVGGEKSSDCRDHIGILDASGSASCDDYPGWGTSLRPIRSLKCGLIAVSNDFAYPADVPWANSNRRTPKNPPIKMTHAFPIELAPFEAPITGPFYALTDKPEAWRLMPVSEGSRIRFAWPFC